MSSLPADATVVDIQEEILYQQTLIASLDPDGDDYAERSAEMQTELSLLEERLARAQDSSVDTSDSSINLDSASTTLTVPSQSSSRSVSSSKRPLPSSFLSDHGPTKRPSPSPSTATASYQEKVRRMQVEAELNWKLRQLQRERDAQYAQELSMRGADTGSHAAASSSRPAWQSTLRNNGTFLPPVRSLLRQPPTQPEYPPQPVDRNRPQTHNSMLPSRIKQDPQHTIGSLAPPRSSQSEVIDLTEDDPQSRSLLPNPSASQYPTLPSQPVVPSTYLPGAYAQGSPAVAHSRAPYHTTTGHNPVPSASTSRILPWQHHLQSAPSTMSAALKAGSLQWPHNVTHNLQNIASRISNPLQQLQDLVGSSSFNNYGHTNEFDDEDDDEEDDDGLVYLGHSGGMPGSYNPYATVNPYQSINPYAGREDLYYRRFEELESYNPEKTKEEINALLNNIRPDEELPDHLLIQTPAAMSIKLHKYQELGLTWLKKCEEGSNQGGILADDMGLGKTIQMLSLIVSRTSDNPRCRTTLIVAPVALLRQWKQEVEQKIKRSSALTVHIHHAGGKKTHFRDLAVFDIVLTTFGSLAIEARRMDKYLMRKKTDPRAVPRTDERCVLIGEESQWYRVILDEAQCIKNKDTQTARAACMLSATYRFCMTGTPMMNNVGELYSLVKFLRIKPYDRWEKFRQDISQPLKGSIDGFRDAAMSRLQALCKAVMLRRTKKSTYRGKPILILPERTTEVDAAVFDEDEQSLYTALEQKTQVTFNKYLAAGAIGRSYSAILVLLLRLRQACCHPFLIKDLSIAAAADMSQDDLLELSRQLSEQAIVRIKETNGNFECPICMDAVINPAIFLPCGHDTCRECYVKLADTSTGIAQGHENGVKARCPHCRGDIDPKKITDFTSFKRVWMPELLTAEEKKQFNILEEEEQQQQEAAVENEDDVSTESESGGEDETDSEDEGSDLDGFIVDDNESESELVSKKEGKRKAVDHQSKERKSKKNSKKNKKKKKKPAAVVDKPEKLLTIANLKANARGSSKKKAMLIEKLRESYKDSAKIRQMLALLDTITADDPTEKVLIFSQWTSLLDLCEIAVEPKGWDYRRYDGSMNAKERADAVDDFKDESKDVRIMLVSLKAGNAGLNLNVASQVIILDPFWNPYIEEQAIDRAHRIGQTRPVKVHRILIENTVEDRILTLQENKRKIIETALDEQQAAQLSRLGARELAYLFGVSRNI